MKTFNTLKDANKYLKNLGYTEISISNCWVKDGFTPMIVSYNYISSRYVVRYDMCK